MPRNSSSHFNFETWAAEDQDLMTPQWAQDLRVPQPKRAVARVEFDLDWRSTPGNGPVRHLTAEEYLRARK